MLYFTVGSRGLDGGLMCTASHNPKAYTGAKLVKRGAIALSGDAGIGELKRDRHERRARRAGRRRAAATSARTSRRSSRPPRPRSSTWTRSRPMKVVLDGGNGMAGPMVGPLLDRLPIEQVQTYWTPDGELPRPRAEPAAARRTAASSSRRCSRRAPSSGIAWDGDADRCFFIDDTRPVRGRRLPHRAARRVDPREGARRGDPLRRARQPRGARTRSSAPAGPRS